MFIGSALLCFAICNSSQTHSLIWWTSGDCIRLQKSSCSGHLCFWLSFLKWSDLTFILHVPEFPTRKLINTNKNIEGKFPRDFTDRNIPSVYTDGITVEKNFKTKQKKKITCHFYQQKIPSVNCEHCSSCQLQRESPTKFSVGIFQIVLFGGFLKKFN